MARAIAVVVGGATGVASWLVLMEVLGVDEPWDASWFWPAMLATSFVVGLIVARRPFWLGCGISAGQLVTMLWLGGSSLFLVLGFIAAAALAGVWGLAAWAGMAVRGLLARRLS